MRESCEACLTYGMPRHTSRQHPGRQRAGFTLVEIVVALVLMAIAAVGVASCATFVARLAATARSLALATRSTAQVVDSLRATPCASLGAGRVATPAGAVRWTTTASPGTRLLRATLTPASSRVRTSIVEEALLPCD